MRAAILIVLALIACACGGGDDEPLEPADYAGQAAVIAGVPGAVAGDSGGDLTRIGEAYVAAAEALRELTAPAALADAGDELAAAFDEAAAAHTAAAETGKPGAVVRAAEAVERVTAARQALARAVPR